MGVDAILYAIKSNEYYECDRDRNIKIGFYNYLDKVIYLTPEEEREMGILQDKLERGWVFTKQEIITIVKANIKISLAQIPDPKEKDSFIHSVIVFHNAKMLVMALNALEDEEFRIITDMSDEYYDIKKQAKEHYVRNW